MPLNCRIGEMTKGILRLLRKLTLKLKLSALPQEIICMRGLKVDEIGKRNQDFKNNGLFSAKGLTRTKFMPEVKLSLNFNCECKWWIVKRHIWLALSTGIGASKVQLNVASKKTLPHEIFPTHLCEVHTQFMCVTSLNIHGELWLIKKRRHQGNCSIDLVLWEFFLAVKTRVVLLQATVKLIEKEKKENHQVHEVILI